MAVSPHDNAFPAHPGLPSQAGIGFKPQHFDALLDDAAPPAFVEVHAENYMGAGGRPHTQLTALRERMPISLHGVGLSIGGESPPDARHLERIARLIARYSPSVFSEHLAWSSHGGVFYNDLLPLCYDKATLDRVCEHVDLIQNRLGVRMLLENPSTYVAFEDSTYSESKFLASIIRRTGCGLLLDVNNVHVSCHNNGTDPATYLGSIPLQAIGQIHLAGHAEAPLHAKGHLLIDSHGAPVAEAVWALYAEVLAQTGPLPTLIEWDTDVPAYATLRAGAVRAQQGLDRAAAAAGALAA